MSNYFDVWYEILYYQVVRTLICPYVGKKVKQTISQKQKKRKIETLINQGVSNFLVIHGWVQLDEFIYGKKLETFTAGSLNHSYILAFHAYGSKIFKLNRLTI